MEETPEPDALFALDVVLYGPVHQSTSPAWQERHTGHRVPRSGPWRDQYGTVHTLAAHSTFAPLRVSYRNTECGFYSWVGSDLTTD